MKLNVLFLCTGNSARSQMAEALLRARHSDLFVPFSTWLEPKGMNPFTIKTLDEIGISTKGQYSKGLATYLGKQFFTYLITVCADAEEKCPTVWPGVKFRLHWKFDDPAAFVGSEEDKLAEFRRIRNQIDAQLATWVAEIREKQAANA